jgi:hypothetical protein
MPGAPKPQPPEKPEKRPLASPREVAAYLGGGEHEITEDTLKDWRYKHTGPKYSRVGKHVRYNWDDVDAWLAARCVDPRTVAQDVA